MRCHSYIRTVCVAALAATWLLALDQQIALGQSGTRAPTATAPTKAAPGQPRDLTTEVGDPTKNLTAEPTLGDPSTGESARLIREMDKLLKRYEDLGGVPPGSEDAAKLAELLRRARALERSEASLKASSGPAPDPSLPAGRDPFAITERLKRVSTDGVVEGVQFVPSATVPGSKEVPRMQLRGIVRMSKAAEASAKDGKSAKGKAADDKEKAKKLVSEVAAILEVEGAGTHIVREGDTVGLQQLGSDAVVKVLRVDRLSLVVEVGTLGQVIIVR